MRILNLTKIVLTLALTIGMFTAAQAADTEYVKKRNTSEFGNILTGSNGMTLYTFAKDTTDTSNCYDGCAKKWPPLVVADRYSFDNMGGKLGLTMRKGGEYQVTYMGKPLYYWFKDKKPGDTTGHKVKNVWFVVK